MTTEDSKPPVIWEDPPNNYSNAKYPWDEFYAVLRQNPGKWGQFAYRVPTGVLSNQKRKRATGYEIIGRNQKDGQTDVYARFVGKDGEWA